MSIGATPRVLVAGIGNVFLGDDGFGCEVVRHLTAAGSLRDVRLVDYGIRGLHLAYDLVDGWDLAVLVDALPDRGHPGRVDIFEIRADDLAVARLEPHGMDPVAVLASVTALGGTMPTTFLVGVQVADVDERMGLTAVVSAAVGPAAAAVERLVCEHRSPARSMLAQGVG